MLIIKLLKKAGVKSSLILNLDEKWKREKNRKKVERIRFHNQRCMQNEMLLPRRESASISAMYDVVDIPITY